MLALTRCPLFVWSNRCFATPILQPGKGILVLRHAHTANFIGGSGLRHQGLTDRERVVLAELASHDPAQFTPTLALLAVNLYGEDNRRTRDQCRKMIRALQAKEVLAVRYISRGVKWKLPSYVLMLGDVARTSPTTKVPSSERQVTLAQRQGDVGSQGLRAKDQVQPKKKKKLKKKRTTSKGDVAGTSPTQLKGGKLGDLQPQLFIKTKASSAMPEQASSKVKMNKNCKQIVNLLRENPDGMFGAHISHSLGKNTIDLKNDFNLLVEAGLIHQRDNFKLGRFFLGRKDDAS